MEIKVGDAYIYHGLYGRIVKQDGGTFLFSTPHGSTVEGGFVDFATKGRHITTDIDKQKLADFEAEAKHHPDAIWYRGFLTAPLVKIEFFPDYSADGVWVTHEGHCLHAATTIEDLQKELDVVFPRWFINKIETMQRMFDVFAPSYEEDFHKKYGLFSKHMMDIDMIEHIILTDFKTLFPQHAHLVAYSNGNEYDVVTRSITIE